mmetsp:Transcript_62379/g.182250  ORF Transcript_62379/g.182250 Transcript_62379/m.182250 type:complete len:529 (-) Transcript_62379:19-1605(-)
MWARRCGAPRQCPSRVKVIIFSAFDGTIGLSIYLYMAGSNISYLDLGAPASSEVLCLDVWPSSGHAIKWSQPHDWLSWWRASSDLEDMLARHRCEVPGLTHVSCRRILAPLSDMKRPLAVAMSGEETTRIDILGMSARFFLLVTISIWIGMATHDLALIGRAHKDFILDVAGVNQHVPVIRRVWRCLAGYRPLFRILAYERPAVRLLGIALAVVLAPALIIWNLLVFNFVIVPLLLLVFARYPIRMSRAWVFVVCLACSIYGLVLLTLQLAYLYTPHARPRYAVTWHAEAVLASIGGNRTGLGAGAGAGCKCGCDYPISFGASHNLAVIGAVTTMKSAFVAFRCLKGLRRSQWANLLSVVFPVPITVYAVDWRQNGQPIRGRSESIAVQEEVAFDPFALMDEQADSQFTTLHVRPEPMNAYRSSDGKRLVPMRVARTLETPAMPNFETATLQLVETEHIGCCGFPWRTGGKKGVFSDVFVEALYRRTFHVLEPRGCGTPGMRLSPTGPTPQPRDHDPPKVEGWDIIKL